jgi:hypothetical protein
MAKTTSLRGRLAVGTALAGVMLTGYGRAIAGTCVEAPNPIVCAGPANPALDVTQTLTFTPTITQAVTTAGFGIDTAAGDAIDLNGSGSFNDQNMSTIAGAVAGVYGKNYGAAALSITTTGAVTGRSGAGIYGYNAPSATDLTINAASASGALQGISGRNYGTGALSIVASGMVTGTTKAGIFAYERGGTSLTINAAAVSGGNSGINALNSGTGPLSITTSGAVSGAGAGSPGSPGAYRTGSGIYAYGGGAGGVTVNAMAPVTATGSGSVGIGVEAASTVTGAVNITATDTSGTNHGIFVQNYGSGGLSVTSTGTDTGNTKSGIAALSATGLTLNANAVNGGASGIYAHTTGAGTLSITTTGAVKSTGTGSPATSSGIYALVSGAGAVTVAASGPISASTSPLASSYGVAAENTAAATGAMTLSVSTVTATTGVLALNKGSGALSVTANGLVTGLGRGIAVANTGGTATTITVAGGGGAMGGIAGIEAYSSNQPLTITNAGSISNSSNASTDLAISTGNDVDKHRDDYRCCESWNLEYTRFFPIWGRLERGQSASWFGDGNHQHQQRREHGEF